MKRFISFLLVLIISFSFIGIPKFKAETLGEKEEVIYGILKDDGQVEDIYVVNSFTKENIIDYGNYLEVKNLTSREEIVIDGDKLSIKTSKDNFYYQGKLEQKDLPWEFRINYKLDGEGILAKDLAGKSGYVEIEIEINKNENIKEGFFENFMLQATLSLNTERFTEISSEKGVMARAGKNQVIAHTILPGIEGKIEVSAKVVNFEMEGIEISAMPFTMGIDMSGIESLTGQLTGSLKDAVEALSNGIGDLSQGLGLLSEGSLSLVDGSSDVKGGLDLLSANSINLIAASSQIKAGLEAINSGLADSFSIEDFLALPGALNEMSDGINEIVEGLMDLNTGYSLAYEGLHNAIMSIPSDEIDPTSLYMAIYGDLDLQSDLDSLIDYYAAAKTIQGTYMATKEAFLSVGPALVAVASSLTHIKETLAYMAVSLENELTNLNKLGKLKEGIESLASNYKEFHIGLDEYMGGIKDLSVGYALFHTGLRDLNKGMIEASEGANEIHKGGLELRDGLDQMPELIQDEIDNLNKSDYKIESFVSSKNENVKAVQFVLKTGGIKEEVEEVVLANPVKLSFWQKILKLLGLYK